MSTSRMTISPADILDLEHSSSLDRADTQSAANRSAEQARIDAFSTSIDKIDARVQEAIRGGYTGITVISRGARAEVEAHLCLYHAQECPPLMYPEDVGLAYILKRDLCDELADAYTNHLKSLGWQEVELVMERKLTKLPPRDPEEFPGMKHDIRLTLHLQAIGPR